MVRPLEPVHGGGFPLGVGSSPDWRLGLFADERVDAGSGPKFSILPSFSDEVISRHSAQNSSISGGTQDRESSRGSPPVSAVSSISSVVLGRREYGWMGLRSCLMRRRC